MTLEVLDFHPEFAPLGGREPNYARWLDYQPLLHHLPELGRDDQHRQVLDVLDLDVEPDRLSGALLVSCPSLAPHDV